MKFQVYHSNLILILQVKTTYTAKQTRSLQDACSECWPTVDLKEKSSGILSVRAEASPTIATTKLHVIILFAFLTLIIRL